MRIKDRNNNEIPEIIFINRERLKYIIKILVYNTIQFKKEIKLSIKVELDLKLKNFCISIEEKGRMNLRH